ncbi:28183_t:CDS:2 [Gigaspora margarita]|uniref:28183_t:CDS:1 n=1 Tax=Gigaspora margarita TaxID=4874 RepID=A0ABN7UDX8_GIGMA|nr:28183_t:CDS:2 [Gigaspora margarita]
MMFKEGGVLPERIHTILELKRPRSVSDLSDEAKGQLLDYVRILVQKQPSRQELNMPFPALLWHMISQKSPYV